MIGMVMGLDVWRWGWIHRRRRSSLFPSSCSRLSSACWFLVLCRIILGSGDRIWIWGLIACPVLLLGIVSASVRSSHVLMVSIVVVMCVGMVNRNGWQMSRSFGRKGVGVLRGNSGRGF